LLSVIKRPKKIAKEMMVPRMMRNHNKKMRIKAGRTRNREEWQLTGLKAEMSKWSRNEKYGV